jgi:Flp pilus assembly protein TadD
MRAPKEKSDKAAMDQGIPHQAVSKDPREIPVGRGSRFALLGGLGVLVLAAAWWLVAPESVDGLKKVGQKTLAENGDVSAIATALENRGCKSDALLLRAESAMKRGDLRKALAFAESVPDANSNLDAICIIGESLLIMGQPSPAGERFQSVLSRDPENRRALLGLAAAWYDLGALVRTLEPAEKAAQLDPKDGRALHLLGSVHLQLGERAVGREKLNQAAERELPPMQEREVIRQLMELDLADGRVEEADLLAKRLADYQLASPREQALILWLEELKAETDAGRNAAFESLKRLALAHPKDASLSRWLGEMAMRSARADDAIGPLQAAIQLEPQALEPRHLLAQALERAGQPGKAAQVRADLALLESRLKKMTELNGLVDGNPLDPGPRLEMAALCEQMGRSDWARHWRDSAKGLAAVQR